MIRAANEKDLPAMLEIYRPYVEESTCSFEYNTPCLRSFTQRFYEHIAQYPWLVWEADGRVLGYAYAGPVWERAAYRWCTETSIYISRDCQGHGIGKALYERLEEILAKQGYRAVYAIITGENENSLAFHRAVGYGFRAKFENCGYKFGRWIDVVWLEKRLNPTDDPAGFPKKWTECI